MAKKAFFKGERFIFSRVKGNAETDYREGDINITPTNLGLGSVNNTSDKNKPVSTAQQKAIDTAYANSNKYTDQKIADLINGAPETLDTLKEVADAISASKSTEEALNKAIGTKANQSELDTHTGNDTIHITASERAKWNNQGVTGIRGSAETNYKTGQVTISKDNIGLENVDNTKDSSKTVYAAQRMIIQDNSIDGSSESFKFHPEYSAEHLGTSFDIVGYNKNNKVMTYGSPVDTIDTRYASTTFTSNDSTTGDYTPPAVLRSGETHASIFSKVSTLFKNVRWLLSKMGTTDISSIGNGTVTGALSTLNSNITKIYHYYGELVNGQNTNIKAYGHADIIIYNNNLVQINFSYKFTSEDKDAPETWKFGINSNLFVNLVGCSIIPISGGTVLYYKADGSLALNALEYCGIMIDNDNYWNPARLYTTDGAVGGWSSTYYDIGDYAIGTCYGLIPSLG